MPPIILFLANVCASPGSCSHGNRSLQEGRLLEGMPGPILYLHQPGAALFVLAVLNWFFKNMDICTRIPMFHTLPFSSGK